MRKKLVHPVWVHLPAVFMLVVFIVVLLISLPLPSEVGVHFTSDGIPDRTGSPWGVAGIVIGLSFLFIGISVLFDELWARQETRKSFNWLSLLDDIIVGSLAGSGLGYLAYVNDAASTYSFPGTYFWAFLAGTAAAGIILELVRPYRPFSEPLTATETQGLREELSRKMRDGSPFVYWDYQDPVYVSLLSTILPLVMFGAAAATWMEIAWVGILLIVVGLALIIPYGGQRTLVTRDGITVRWGIFGIPVLRLKTTDIVEAVEHDFSPIKDFGGYGIRFNREMKAYYLRGNHGVLITLRNGKKYLIGSDRPADLLAVTQGIAEAG